MKKKNPNSQLLLITIVFIIISSCSTKKDRWVNRQYHNTTTKYNGYFNGRESLKKGLKKIKESSTDNYNDIITVFEEKDLDKTKTGHQYMDKAIKKGSVVIQRHSMNIKGKERCKWIDDNYLMIGKAYFYKGEFDEALKTFLFIIDEFSKSETAYQAKIFALRAYSEKEDFMACERLIDELNKKTTISKKTKALKHRSIAECYIKQKNYSLAIDELKDCIQLSKKRNTLRQKFILAQIYQKLGVQKNADILFQEVVRGNPHYEMVFNSKMNLAKSSIVTGINVKKAKDDLYKMINDDKNKEYLDQIYYTIAEIELAEMDTSSAINSLSKSTKHSVQNDRQKALSFLKLATVNLNQRDYTKSSFFYDSTTAYMDENEEGFSAVFEQSERLKKLITQLKIVHLEDSLVLLSQLPEKVKVEKINKIIKNIVEAEKEEERKKNSMEQRMYENSRFGAREQFGNRTSGGKWYFYNPSTLSFGLSEFIKKWGKRKLEDNWRRKDKTTLNNIDLDTLINEQKDSLIKEVSNKKTPAFYLSKIPKSKKELTFSKNKSKEALYKASIMYRDFFDDYFKSNEALREVISRSKEDTVFSPLSYYNIYINYKNQEKALKAVEIKKLIIKKYPNSKYAKILQDTRYVSSKKTQTIKDEKNYKTLKDEYLKGNYKYVILNTEKEITKTLINKEKFLRALSFYHLEDTITTFQ